MVRRRNALRDEEIRFELPILSGDAATQHAVQRTVLRSGDDREELGREGFAHRALQFEHDAILDLRDMLDELRIDAQLESSETRASARIAFVRLYEAGLLRHANAAVDSCPTCETVVDAVDVDVKPITQKRIVLNLPTGSSSIEFSTTEPELLVGAAAIAVPPQHDAAWSNVAIPALGLELPVISIAQIDKPTVVLPAHDAWSFEVATVLGLPIIDILDSTGVIRHEGALNGMTRHAARVAAIESLEAAGNVVVTDEVEQDMRQCHRCGTALIAMFGTHWIISLGEIMPAFIELVQNDVITCDSPETKAQLIDTASNIGDWCVSQQLWSGLPIPVATCLDCGQLAVSVSDDSSCGACMGTLQYHDDVLDARFVASISPLITLGWPNSLDKEVVTILSVSENSLSTWALPVGALGLRLTGSAPYNEIVIQRNIVDVTDNATRTTSDYVDLVRTRGTRSARAALLVGDKAEEAVAVLDRPKLGRHNVGDIEQQFDDAVLAFEATSALETIVNFAREGVESSETHELSKLAESLLGE